LPQRGIPRRSNEFSCVNLPHAKYYFSRFAWCESDIQSTEITLNLIRNAAFAVIAALTLATPALALNRQVTIVNNTGFGIVNFYGSNTGTNDWQEDILGQDILPSGSQVTINFNDGSGYCKFDLKAVFDDGDEVVQEDVNICEVGTFTFN